MTRPTTPAVTFALGDKVLRGQGPRDTTVGTVVAVSRATVYTVHGQAYRQIQVLWADSRVRSWVREDRLLPATRENLAAAREHRRRNGLPSLSL